MRRIQQINTRVDDLHTHLKLDGKFTDLPKTYIELIWTIAIAGKDRKHESHENGNEIAFKEMNPDESLQMNEWCTFNEKEDCLLNAINDYELLEIRLLPWPQRIHSIRDAMHLHANRLEFGQLSGCNILLAPISFNLLLRFLVGLQFHLKKDMGKLINEFRVGISIKIRFWWILFICAMISMRRWNMAIGSILWLCSILSIHRSVHSLRLEGFQWKQWKLQVNLKYHVHGKS